MTDCERKKIMKRHRQNYYNDSNAPAVKQQKLGTRQTVYEVMTPSLKQVYSKRVNNYKCMPKEKKKRTLDNRKTIYKTMEKSKKEKVLAKRI